MEKPNLKKSEREKLKLLAKELLERLKTEQLKVHNWREKESTRAAVRSFIHDYLWNEETGLPSDSYTPKEVEEKAELIYGHIFQQYVDAWNNVYLYAR